MNKPAEISVLLPFYNPGEGLAAAIQSIRNQTFPGWELILVNNASTDVSVAIGQELAAQDSRIRLVDEPEKGIVPALNTGLQHCRAPLVARMDADDISLPHRLELQYRFMQQHPETGLCAGIVDHMSPEANTKGYGLYVDWINSLLTHEEIALNRFIESPFAHPSVMFRMDCVQQHGAYRNGDFPEDYELWLRWMEAGVRVAKVPEVILEWHDTPGRLSRTDMRYHPEAFYQVKTHYLDLWLRRNNPFFPDLVIWGAGRYARKRAKYLKALGHNILFYIDIDPKKAQRVDCRLYTGITSPDQFFVLSLAGKRGARQMIRGHLGNHGFVEGRDFLLAAGV